VREAPKRPVQTPQREWLRGPLRDWANDHIEAALSEHEGRWLDGKQVRRAWSDYQAQGADNSFPVWQWVSLGLMERKAVA
jgi:asparagine synthase (glutamine-hydrolysing)